MKQPVFLTEDDIFRITLYTQVEAADDFFFELEDMNAEVDQELIDRYKAIEQQFNAIQKELRNAITKGILK